MSSAGVNAGGITWLDWMIQLIVLALLPAGVFLVIFASGPKYPVDFYPRLIGIIVFLALLDLLALSVVQVRQVRPDAEGVTFRYLFHTERRAWKELEPGTERPLHQQWYLISRQKGGKPAIQRSFQLTLRQVHAILTYPSCPAWKLPPEIAALLKAPPRALGPLGAA